MKKNESTQPSPQTPGGPVGPAGERLKAERVQLQLKQLPGWHLRAGGRAIARTFALTGTRHTLAFLDTLKALAAKGSLPQVELRPGKATITLWSPKAGWLAAEDYELAISLKVSS